MENWETSETSEFSFRVFDFEYWAKIEKSEEKKSENEYPTTFSTFPSFRPGLFLKNISILLEHGSLF